MEREAREAVTKQLEVEALLQRETAKRAEAEKEQAEKDKQQAETFAKTSRRRSFIAMALSGIAVISAFTALAFWHLANEEKKRAEGMALNALAGELVATRGESCQG